MPYRNLIGERGDEAHATAAAGAKGAVKVKNPGQKSRPRPAMRPSLGGDGGEGSMLVASTGGAGTICLRALALGARTPWYRSLSRGRRHQDAEFFYQFQWRQDEKGRTVRSGGFEAKGEVFVIDDLQTSGGQGGRMM